MTLQPCNVWLQNIVIIEVKNAMLGQVGTAFFVLSFQVSRLRLINDIQIYNYDIYIIIIYLGTILCF